uniref:BZIP domain-containing protein n=1 Tax=Schistocephalus solidus TaxID=70667 RepID=A0A0X3PI34_SCHSO
MEVAGDVENALDADMFNFLNEEFNDFDLDMQQILDTPEFDLDGLDGTMFETEKMTADTSDSDSGISNPGDLLLTPREALCLQSSEDVGAATIIGEPPAVSAASLECDSSEVEVPPVVSFQEVPLVAPPSPPTPLYHIQTRTPIIRSTLPIHPKAIQNRTSPPATEHVTLTTTHFRQMPFGAKRHCLSTIPHRTIAFQRPNVLHVPIKSVDAVRKTMPTSTNPIKLESDWASGSLSSASDSLHLSSNTVANASGNLTDVRAVMSRQSLFPPSVPSGTDVAPYTTNSAHTQSFGVTRPSTLALVPLFSDGTRVQSNHHHQQQQHHPVQPFGADLITIDELSLPMHALREVSEETCDKIIKKQERMIKNRQAACLSRLRKKEYLGRLEMRLLQLKEENAHLRQENHEWRHRYDHLEKCLEDVRSELSSLSPSYSSRILMPPVTSSQISPASSSSFSPSADSCTSPSTSDTSTSLDPLPLTSLATTTDRLARLPTILPKNESRPPSALSDYTHLPTFTLSRGSVGPHKQSAERSVMQKNNSLPRVLSVSRGGVPLATTGARGPSESFTLGFLPQTAAKASATSAFPAAYSLPRGGRKKVTTSLFALTCLLALNTFVFPLFNQPPANVRSLSSDKNVGLPSGGFGSVFPERVLGPGVRTLLSMPADSLTEARPAMVDSDRISPVTINSTNCTEARSPEPEVPGPSLNSSAPGFPSSVDVKKSQQVLVLLHGPGSKEDNLSPHNLSTREIVPRLTRVLRRRQRLRDRLILQDRTFQESELMKRFSSMLDFVGDSNDTTFFAPFLGIDGFSGFLQFFDKKRPSNFTIFVSDALQESVSGKPDEAAKYYRISQLEVQIASVKQHRISYV